MQPCSGGWRVRQERAGGSRLRKSAYEMEDLDDNQQVYLLDLIQFLLNWLANHILACDKKIGEYMRENHISE